MRDGDFFGALVDAYPYFLLTPLFSVAAIYAGTSRPYLRAWAGVVIVLFLLLPDTRFFTRYWFTHLNPFRLDF